VTRTRGSGRSWTSRRAGLGIACRAVGYLPPRFRTPVPGPTSIPPSNYRPHVIISFPVDVHKLRCNNAGAGAGGNPSPVAHQRQRVPDPSSECHGRLPEDRLLPNTMRRRRRSGSYALGEREPPRPPSRGAVMRPRPRPGSRRAIKSKQPAVLWPSVCRPGRSVRAPCFFPRQTSFSGGLGQEGGREAVPS